MPGRCCRCDGQRQCRGRDRLCPPFHRYYSEAGSSLLRTVPYAVGIGAGRIATQNRKAPFTAISLPRDQGQSPTGLLPPHPPTPRPPFSPRLIQITSSLIWPPPLLPHRSAFLNADGNKLTRPILPARHYQRIRRGPLDNWPGSSCLKARLHATSSALACCRWAGVTTHPQGFSATSMPAPALAHGLLF